MSGSVATRTDTQLAAADIPARISDELVAFTESRLSDLLRIDAGLDVLVAAARGSVLGGGKRLRPLFTYWGWRSVLPAGAAGEPALVRAAASLELLHACALVHDDVMDSSDTRRGRPSAHIALAAGPRAQGWPGDPDAFGVSGAILLGDLLLTWSEELFSRAIRELALADPGAHERGAAATHQFDLMRTEVVAGQFLDLLAQTRGAFDADQALRVLEYKTTKYTVERPLLVGAAAAGAADAVTAALSSYGRAVGEAFQLRDDLLGVFGDPQTTGKPAGDDLREGKRTLLVALAADRSGPAGRALLARGVGDPALDQPRLEAIRQLLVETGARSAVEDRIVVRVGDALAALDDGSVTAEAANALRGLADAAAHRDA